MSAHSRQGRARRSGLRSRALVAIAIATLASAWVASGSSRASEPVPTIPAPQPVIGAPGDLTLFGASSAQATGESWGYSMQPSFGVFRYTRASGVWQALPPPQEASGEELHGFQPIGGELAAAATPAGGLAIVGEDAAKAGQVLIRDPSSDQIREAPTLTAEPPGGTSASEPNALLAPGETLFGSGAQAVVMTPVEEPESRTGVFLAPFESTGVQQSVLGYDGKAWAREPICAGIGVTPCKAPPSGFKVLALGASSTENAWLLAQDGEGIVLFGREGSGAAARWTQRSLGESGSQPGEPGWLGAQFAQASPPFENPTTHEKVSVHVSALANGEPFTVTARGLWVDGQLGVEVAGHARQTSDFTLYYDVAAHRVVASWCAVPAQAGAEVARLCTHSAPELELPSGAYRSFAWPGGGPYGTRIVPGLADGVSLSLRGEAFEPVLGLGGERSSESAAFSSPEDGWLGNRGPLTHLTTEPAPDLVQTWPVPFRRPLTAVATQPGTTPGELGAQAIAVGQEGQVAHYFPGQGWVPEALLNSAGEAQKPSLRGVAWPEPGRAYAVGADGQMWLWRSATGLWEPDPTRPPNLVLANFTGIAFNPSNPTQGYAIGQQGVLLGFGKSWTQEPLPPGLEHADFTSVAFAGGEALVTYQIPEPSSRNFTGGLLVNDGSGWSIAQDPAFTNMVPVRVAGLADGGAAVALTNGNEETQVITRQGGQGSAWSPAQTRLSGFPAALAAFREGGTLRAVVSLDDVTLGASDLGEEYAVDEESARPQPGGQAPVASEPYPLPKSGYLLRETADGWQDQEHQDYPAPGISQPLAAGQTGVDWPVLPDAVLALALSSTGDQGWAVGGQTGEINRSLEEREAIQTAGVMRYPASGAPPAGFSRSPISTGSANATFAIGGDAQCAVACANLAEDQLGPDEGLSNAIATAGATPGVRAFLYAGTRLAPGLDLSSAAIFQHEESRYAKLLSSPGGPPEGELAAPAETDLDPEGNLSAFDTALAAEHHAIPGGAPTGAPPPPAGTGAYAFESNASAGAVWVIVLDYSHPALGEAQQCWLAQMLAEARRHGAPAIVIGSRGLGGEAPNPASDGGQVVSILVDGAPPGGCTLPASPGVASAYFFDSPGQNRSFQLTAGAAPPVPEFGSGTLGYVAAPVQDNTQFLGASSFLLAEVNASPGAREANNKAKVSVRLIPDISDLALDATNGVLLRRSQSTLFDALARRPHAGMLCQYGGASCTFISDPYVPIPSSCSGPACATAILPSYTFTSSEPHVGQFVEFDPASKEGTAVLQNAKGEAIPAEPRNSRGELAPNRRFQENTKGEPVNERGEAVSPVGSGVFCAYNAGTTTVTVQAGGLSYSEQITVQAGSVEQPCGTVPLLNPPAPVQKASLPVPPPPPAPAPSPAPAGKLPPPPAQPAPPTAATPPIQHAPVRPAPLPSVPLPPAQLVPLLAIVPPPAPATARPIPPSGTAQVPAQSPVSQAVGVEERERELEEAAETAHHMAAYDPSPREEPLPSWSLALVLVAVGAGVGVRRRRPQLARAWSNRSR